MNLPATSRLFLSSFNGAAWTFPTWTQRPRFPWTGPEHRSVAQRTFHASRGVGMGDTAELETQH